ncbi:MAG: SAM-dependent methyltransferase [Candidatus Magasanikbacteria bacterium]
MRYNEHDPKDDFKKINDFLSKGKDIALVVDSGTPAVSDPGGKLVNFVRRKVEEAEIKVVPGPSAVTAAISVAGVPGNEFSFLGYPPSKNNRRDFFNKVSEVNVRPVVLYESPHRLHKTFDDLIDSVGDIEIFVAKEMTKVYEDYFIGFVSDAKEYFSGKKKKGEFVIIVPEPSQ